MTEFDNTNKQFEKEHSENTLFADISKLINQGRRIIATHENNTAIIALWCVGRRINEDIFQHKRTDCGKRIVSTLSTQLIHRYGKNCVVRNLRRMMQFNCVDSCELVQK